ncbi:hypothetical protein CC78DRAFT_576376 [Lojkania enalia]|uniref:Uncharacterized protein n=1 Tax=Lojkania enalia TaxID=147567 RepID=A0A9P4KGQ8_9PLEO|nr:hypothetical protein CC78DRAFT_576376 [Didymosphaeria enalia]
MATTDGRDGKWELTEGNEDEDHIDGGEEADGSPGGRRIPQAVEYSHISGHPGAHSGQGSSASSSALVDRPAQVVAISTAGRTLDWHAGTLAHWHSGLGTRRDAPRVRHTSASISPWRRETSGTSEMTGVGALSHLSPPLAADLTGPTGPGAARRSMRARGQYIMPLLGALRARQSASEIKALGPNCALPVECHALAAASVDHQAPFKLLDGKRTRGVMTDRRRAGVPLMLSSGASCRRRQPSNLSENRWPTGVGFIVFQGQPPAFLLKLVVVGDYGDGRRYCAHRPGVWLVAERWVGRWRRVSEQNMYVRSTVHAYIQGIARAKRLDVEEINAMCFDICVWRVACGLGHRRHHHLPECQLLKCKPAWSSPGSLPDAAEEAASGVLS